MFVLANMWFQTLMRQFFFNIDKIVFNFIPTIYDFLVSIARTSVLSQADIVDMADRIYKMLAIFMVFKVTFSLIMYVVNPDDFSDKSKGVGKLGTNIVISLSLLILTPYVFNLAYQLQTIILEDNSLSVLIFGEANENTNDSAFNSAGDNMAYITMTPFFTPNLALDGLNECSILTTKEGSEVKFNGSCEEALMTYTTDEDGNENSRFTEQTLKTYMGGVTLANLSVMFRQDMAIATNAENTDYIIDYKYIFSTVVGVVVILLLVTFCLDVALRSIKLAFLQLIAPIPIISFVDPKSGKDGMFKKWYEMCFKTYISLFIRLLALYFVAYIVSRLDRMVDIVDGSYVTNALVQIFIIIGALMFAKQLPKILEGLGIKLDGGFTLNPLKKIENEMLGGKQVSKVGKGALKYTGRAAKGLGMAGLVGGAALATGQGFRGTGKAFMGSMKGEKFGKNFSNSYAAAKARNRQVEQMKLDGVSPSDIRREKTRNFFRGTNSQDEYKDFSDSIKAIQSGYEDYYKGVLGSDKVAKMLEQRRIAAENAGDYQAASNLQDAIDARVADVRKNHGKVSLSVKDRQKMEQFGADVAAGKKTYASDFGADSGVMGLSSDVDKGLNSIETKIGKTIEHIDSHYDGRFDYNKEELGKYTKNSDGTYSVEDLKTTNGKSKSVSRAATNSDEAKDITNVYKYMDSKK